MHRLVQCTGTSLRRRAWFHTSRELQPGTPKKYVEPPIFSGKNSLNALKDIQAELRRTGTHPLLFHMSRDFIAIYDQFPKSKYHLLVLPKYADYSSVHMIDARKHEDVRFLTEMVRFGDEIVYTILKKIEPSRVFITGYHTIPSLCPIHLHVMSVDLAGRAMKKRKHYNSFATRFFLESHQTLQKVIDKVPLDSHEFAEIDLQKLPMKCLWCEAPLHDVETWKSHLNKCQQQMVTV